MRKLLIYIEIEGKQRYAGSIEGDSFLDADFSYDKDYISSGYAAPISISLPLQEEAFTAKATRIFFEGLLPEGFSRKAVAQYIKSDENDYLTMLSVLGNECLGAIRVVEDSNINTKSEYQLLDMEQVKALAGEGATKSTQILMETHLCLTGATGKVGLYYDKENDSWYLPKGNAPSTYIVKQSHVRLSRIVLNEQLCILTAKAIGIETPDSFIVNVGQGEDPDILYATRRYDRVLSEKDLLSGLPVPYRLHQEDFSQALSIASADKYELEDRGYLSKMMDAIRFNCAEPLKEQNKLWQMICFNYLIGNTDSHIKNYSLLYNTNLKGIKLAPAYDIVSTRVYNMTKNMSFYIGGQLDIEKIKRNNFEAAAGQIGMPTKLAMNIFDDTADEFEKALDSAAEELFNVGFDDVEALRKDIILKGGYRNL